MMHSLSTQQFKKLSKKSLELRKILLEYTKKKSSFIGSCFSCLEILIYIYYHKYNLTNNAKFRDRFILSKGHAAPALYSILFNKKLISRNNFFSNKTYWHPNKDINFIDFQTGALGHGLPVAAGFSTYYKKNKKNKKIIVIIGDGELNEGSIWETFFISQQWKLKNLVIIIDKNKFQANDRTDKVINLKSQNSILKKLGFEVLECDGHNFNQIDQTFNKISLSKPTVIIANTIRNHGVVSINNKKEFWYLDKNSKDISKFEKISL